jgi:hypothetical protein
MCHDQQEKKADEVQGISLEHALARFGLFPAPAMFEVFCE